MPKDNIHHLCLYHISLNKPKIMVTERKPKLYLPLTQILLQVQTFKELLLAHQLVLDHRRKSHRLDMIKEHHTSIRSNMHSKHRKFRTIHQSIKRFENQPTHCYDHTNAKITLIRPMVKRKRLSICFIYFNDYKTCIRYLREISKLS